MRSESALVKSEPSALLSKHQLIQTKAAFRAVQKDRPHRRQALDEVPAPQSAQVRKVQIHVAFVAAQLEDSNTPEEKIFCLIANYFTRDTPKTKRDWFIDSGCSEHVTYDRDLFSLYIEHEQSNVKLGDGNSVKVVGKGDITLRITVNGDPRHCRLLNVLHVPDLGYQLLSLPKLHKQSSEVTFKSRRCYIKKHSSLVATPTMTGNLYKLDTHKPSLK